MKLRTSLGLIIFFFFLTSNAQQIEIVDEASGKPVADAFIYHENKSDLAYTDEEGVANLSTFPKGLVFIQHPSYYEKSVAYLGSDVHVALSEKIIAFNEVVISANKWEQNDEEISQQIISINKKSIVFQNPATSADMLAGSGQVFVQKSQLGGGSPKLRGFAANSVLLVVDGVRMNNAIFRSGNLQNIINIDPNALESSEVIFGPGSVIYGSDALGGVMDFHTVSLNWSKEAQSSLNLMTRYASAANEGSGHLDFSITKPKVALFHSTTFSGMGDLKAGSNRSNRYKNAFQRNFYVQRINGEDQLIQNDDINLQRFSGYDLFNTVSKIKVKLSEKLDMSYGFYYSTTSDIPRYDNLTETIGATDSLEAAEWYYGPQKWQMHNLRFNYYGKNKFFDQGRFIMAFQTFEESRSDRAFGDDRLRTRTENVDMYSFSADFDKAFYKSNLYYGFDFFHNEISSEAFRRNIETGELSNAQTRYPNGGSSYTSSAIYGSVVHSISDELTLNGGLRFNAINLSASTLDSTAISNQAAQISLKNGALNGAIGLALKISDQYKLSYNISSGFRAPNVDDVGKVFEVGDGITVPNQNLKPEYSISNEVSIERKTEHSIVRLVSFYSRLVDAIVDGPSTINGSSTLNDLSVFSKVNTAKAEMYGASLSLSSELSEWFAIEKTITIMDGSDLTNNEPLRHTTPLFGRASVIYKQKKLRFEFFIEYNGNMAREDIPFSEIDRKSYLYTENGSPGWYTLNLRSSYQVNEFINANVSLENILDTHYRPHTSGISAPGRNLILSVRASI